MAGALNKSIYAEKKRKKSVKKVPKIVKNGDNFHHDMVTVTNYGIK